MSSEEFLLQQIFVVAIKDYKKCIKEGRIYPVDNFIDQLDRVYYMDVEKPLDEDIIYNPVTRHTIPYEECACDIVRDISNSCVSLMYKDEIIEKIFRRVDDDMRHWFLHYYGTNWVYPWDIIHNDTMEPIRIEKY